MANTILLNIGNKYFPGTPWDFVKESKMPMPIYPLMHGDASAKDPTASCQADALIGLIDIK